MASKSLQLERYQNFHDEIHTHLGIGIPHKKRIPVILTRQNNNYDGRYFPKKITAVSKNLSDDVLFHEIGHRIIENYSHPDLKRYDTLAMSKKKEVVARATILEIVDEGLATFIGEETYFRKRFLELIKILSRENSINTSSLLHVIDEFIKSLTMKLKNPSKMKKFLETGVFSTIDILPTKRGYQKKLDQFDEYAKCQWLSNKGKRKYEKNGEKLSVAEKLKEFEEQCYAYKVGFTFVRWVLNDLTKKHGFSVEQGLTTIMQHPPMTLEELRDIPAYVDFLVDSF